MKGAGNAVIPTFPAHCPHGLQHLRHKRLTFASGDCGGYTLALANRIAHSGSHGETRGVSDGGAITTLGAFHTFRKPCVARCQNGKLCRFGVLVGDAPEERRKPSEQRCAYARRCSEGVAAPLGCVIFSLLSKLRPVRPIPETSFSSPDAPACAVPVQATSQLVSFRLEADRGFSVLSLCLTSFFDFGDKKRPPTLCAHGAGQRSDFQYSGC